MIGVDNNRDINKISNRMSEQKAVRKAYVRQKSSNNTQNPAKEPKEIDHSRSYWHSNQPIQSGNIEARRQTQNNVKQKTEETLDIFCKALNDIISNNDKYDENDDTGLKLDEGELQRLKTARDLFSENGLFRNDIASHTYDSNDKRAEMMRSVTDYMHDVITYLTKDEEHKERAIEALKIFPPDRAAEYQCEGGAQARLLFAKMKLSSPENTMIASSLNNAVDKLTGEHASKIYPGTEVHLPPASAYLTGATASRQEASEEDAMYRTCLPDISAPVAWDAYRQTLNPLSVVHQAIDEHVNLFMLHIANKKEDGTEEVDVSKLTVANEKQFLRPWDMDISIAWDEETYIAKEADDVR